MEHVGQEGDGLDGLSQSHLIGKDNTVAPKVEEEDKIIFFLLIVFFKHVQTIYLHSTCTRSERASSSHPADNLSAPESHFRCTKVVSSEQQTSAFVLTPGIKVKKTFLNFLSRTVSPCQV